MTKRHEITEFVGSHRQSRILSFFLMSPDPSKSKQAIVRMMLDDVIAWGPNTAATAAHHACEFGLHIGTSGECCKTRKLRK